MSAGPDAEHRGGGAGGTRHSGVRHDRTRRQDQEHLADLADLAADHARYLPLRLVLQDQPRGAGLRREHRRAAGAVPPGRADRMDHHRPAVRVDLPDRRADRADAGRRGHGTVLQRRDRPGARLLRRAVLALLPVRAEPDLDPAREPAGRFPGRPAGRRGRPGRRPGRRSGRVRTAFRTGFRTALRMGPRLGLRPESLRRRGPAAPRGCGPTSPTTPARRTAAPPGTERGPRRSPPRHRKPRPGSGGRLGQHQAQQQAEDGNARRKQERAPQAQ